MGVLTCLRLEEHAESFAVGGVGLATGPGGRGSAGSGLGLGQCGVGSEGQGLGGRRGLRVGDLDPAGTTMEVKVCAKFATTKKVRILVGFFEEFGGNFEVGLLT